ncbi:MAG: hypothetical protein IMZ66_12655 [Planctomycetes bacterium]|nr:hypothetical protein [Planctomycetota bacterium]
MQAIADKAVSVPAAADAVQGYVALVWDRLLAANPLEVALVALPLGLAFLLYGFRLYRWLVVIAYAVVGGVVGAGLAALMGMGPLLPGAIGAIVLGLLAWPMHRLAWGLLGGGVFGTAAAGVAAAAGVEGQVGLILCGALAFILGMVLTMIVMRPLIIVITALVGASALAAAALRLAILWPDLGDPVMETVRTRPYVVMVAVLVLAGVGSMLQVIDTAGRKGRSRGRSDNGD